MVRPTCFVLWDVSYRSEMSRDATAHAQRATSANALASLTANLPTLGRQPLRCSSKTWSI